MLNMSAFRFESGMKMQLPILAIIDKLIANDEEAVAAGRYEEIPDFPVLKKYVDMQRKASVALDLLMKRHIQNLKDEEKKEEEKERKKHAKVSKTKAARPQEGKKISMEDIQKIQENISLF